MKWLQIKQLNHKINSNHILMRADSISTAFLLILLFQGLVEDKIGVVALLHEGGDIGNSLSCRAGLWLGDCLLS